MSAHPPLPPRRQPPSRPSLPSGLSTSSSNTTPDEDDQAHDTRPLGGIAARIAALKLDQVARNQLEPSSGHPPSGNGRPPIPRSVSAKQPMTITPTIQNQPDELEEEAPEPVQLEAYQDPEPIKPSIPRNIRRASKIIADPDLLAKALKRPPPPVPAKSAPPKLPARRASDAPPSPPPRRLPPPIARSPSPEPLAEEIQTAPAKPAPPPRPPVPRGFSQQDEPTPPTPVPPPVNRGSRPPPINNSSKPIISSQPEPTHAHQTPSTSIDDEICLKCRVFDHVDAHAAQFPRENVDTLEQLAWDLTSSFESVTDKARAIFTWLHHNIEYDAYSFLNNCVQPSTPESTLRSGMAVCEGYGGLFANLGQHAGLNVLVINGHGKGYGFAATQGSVVPPYSMNHAWNAVVMDDNEWHLIDSCWGAGALANGVFNKRFAPHHFTMTNIEFGKKHFPTQAEYQLREDGSVISWEEYIMAPEGPPEFADFIPKGYAPELLLPQTRQIVGGYEHVFHLGKICPHRERRDWYDEYLLIVNTEGKNRIPMERDPEGGWTAVVYVPPGSGQVVIYDVATVDGQDAKGLDADTFRRLIGKKAMTFAGIAQFEVV
ncbi:hypothetical protein SISSUDRAFT_1051432 [Sistotremastrum suecicum HHB10207 ss-3]|uniref:Transglutaminase-like domain-containing protein n=1 Tax=Sistotremastrum suecicum HHB10207 ss-3 TaxID=1314776 RepID=A0A166AKA9_9AGAM|nr:hypothetical protein SISSUDRAFT_1051432 [Sistotremastrum suecicum HHB10207 ss-3]